MTLFELTFHVDHVDESLVDTLIDQFEATTGHDHTGQEYVTVLATGSTFDVAARTIFTQLQTYGLCIRRAVPDLLSRADIADRLGVTRQAVQHWVGGKRNVDFPRAVNPVSGGVWLWHDVLNWAVANGRASDDGIAYPSMDEYDALNAWIASGAYASWRGGVEISEKETVLHDRMRVFAVTTQAWASTNKKSMVG